MGENAEEKAIDIHNIATYKNKIGPFFKILSFFWNLIDFQNVYPFSICWPNFRTLTPSPFCEYKTLFQDVIQPIDSIGNLGKMQYSQLEVEVAFQSKISSWLLGFVARDEQINNTKYMQFPYEKTNLLIFFAMEEGLTQFKRVL